MTQSPRTTPSWLPRIRYTAEDGKVICTQAIRFTHGDNEYVGLLRDFRLRYDEPVPIYDLRPRWTTIDFGRTGLRVEGKVLLPRRVAGTRASDADNVISTEP